LWGEGYPKAPIPILERLLTDQGKHVARAAAYIHEDERNKNNNKKEVGSV
jgi:hypothetical protein